MKEIKGDIWNYWKKEGILIGITTNGIVRYNGNAVMGKGIAKQASERIPDLKSRLGYLIRTQGSKVFIFKEWGVFTFPTKYDWKNRSDIELIVKSAVELNQQVNLSTTVIMPKPGCGLGMLDWGKAVKPRLYFLGDNYHFIELPNYRTAK